MRIDVVTPTRGRPERLLEALASLQDQTHQDWRAYVVDDGEGEGVRAAALAADPRVVAFRNPGRGQVDARNAALRVAEGEIVMLLDDDDLLLDPDHLRAVVRRIAAGPALVHRSGWLLFERGGVEVDREPFEPRADAASLRRDNTVLTCGLAWPRALHDLLGRFDAELDGYYDWDWTLRVLDAGVPLVELPGLGVGYRIHEGNGSASRSARRAAAFERFRAKHGLQAVQKDHLQVHRERGLPAAVMVAASGSGAAAGDGA
jgi:glycosyltransferase involved in cell wall biosynthesis